MASRAGKVDTSTDGGLELLKVLGSESLAVTGAAALFTTVYLAPLEPIDRLLTWPERVELALISATWQVALLLVIILGLLAARVCQTRFPQSAWATHGAVLATNAVAAGATLFGLDSLTWINSAQIYAPAVLATLVFLAAYFGVIWLDRHAFQRLEYLVLIGLIGGAAWVAAGGWSKAHHDLLRRPGDELLLGGRELNPGMQPCVLVILADDRMVAYFDDHEPRYRERTKEDGKLTGRPCPSNE